MSERQRTALLFLLLAGILALTTLFSLSVGSVKIEISEIFQSLLGNKTDYHTILWNIRYPRVAFSLITGVNLALSGLLLQAVLKNPLADPGIMGISSGSALGATIIMLVYPVATRFVPLVAFFSGMAAFFMILALSWDTEISPLRLILSGVAVNAIIGGFQSILMTFYSDRLQGVVTWLNGDLSGLTWSRFYLVLGYSVPIYLIIILLIQRLNVLSLSDGMIYSLGISVRKYRILVSAIGVFLAAITVSQVGLISFVGLIVPHVARLLVGGNYKRLVPFTMFLGALIVALADTFARIVISPLEIPIGTIMSIVGGPFFLYLLAKNGKRRTTG